MHKGFRYAFLLAAGVTIPVLTNGCSAVNGVANGLCCKGFQPGADMSTKMGDGSARFGTLDVTVQGQFLALAQASGDLSATASGAVVDVTNACRSIALDMGADPNDPTVTGKSALDAMNAWCDLAAVKITDVTKVGVAITVTYAAPQCSASIKAQADCQGRCDVSGKCDIKANPPTCTGGTLEIDCKGSCDITAQAPKIDCTGKCTGKCEGMCEAQGAVVVDCVGKCDGTCAAGGSSGGTGIQGDGTCNGTCSGKCNVKAGGSVTCQGTCSGSCDAKCDVAPGQASVKCSGKCSADYQPLECKGGKLEGGCQVDASCKANCNASVEAKAECTPGKLAITYTGGAGIEGKVNALVATLEKNLPMLIVVLQGRGKTFVDAIAATAGAVGILGDAKLSVEAKTCGIPMSLAVAQASTDFSGAISASTKVTGAANVK